jgi:hypothetical protein
VRVEAWCPLRDQWQAMRLFDALIANAARTPGDVQYVAASGQLVLTGHTAAFGTGAAVPADPSETESGINARWRQGLAAVASPDSRQELLEVLPRRQYEALLRRAEALAK